MNAVLGDLSGQPLALFRQFTNGEVRDPLNDSRTARLVLSVHDPAAVEVRPLDRSLKVLYGDHLAFHGIILQAETDYTAGTVTINAIDPSLRLKRQYHRYGDLVVDLNYPVDGRGLRMLVASTRNSEAQRARGVPSNHILRGLDTTTHQAAPSEGGIWRRAERGSNVWETIINLSQTLGGPDFRLRPIDRENPGVYNGGAAPPAGFMVELDTADKLGDDLTETIAFEQGFGTNNSEIVHTPDGDVVRNYWVQVYPGGERGRADANRKALYHDEASWLKYGIFQGWESSGQRDSKEVLQAKAKAWVDAYKEVPDFVQVTPRIDVPGVPIYGPDYLVGDLVRVRARAGYRQVSVDGRIISATVRQLDASGNSRVELEVVPHIEGDPAVEGDEA